MHREFDWAAPADSYILEFLAECDGKLKTSSIALNVPYKQQWVGKRCRELAARGLLDQLDEGTFEITARGRQFLAGELDAADLSGDEDG